MAIEPFTIAVDDDRLVDLKARLRRTRWPPAFSDPEWRYGVEAGALRELAAAWTDFDWHSAEADMNRFAHFRTSVRGQPIHFMRLSGRGPDPLPLVLTHGWPWTFWHMRRAAEALTDPVAFGGQSEDVFDVVVPSLPGFAFSTPALPGMNFWKTADLWHELMQTLGYSRYAAAGGDWGAMISAQLGHKYAHHLYGIHLTQAVTPAMFGDGGPSTVFATSAGRAGEPGGVREWATAGERKYAAHLVVQTVEPQTLAYAMHDSPVALLAWLFQRWHGWSDRGGASAGLPVEQMLTDATLYWVTDSFASSARYYADAARYPWAPAHARTPLVPVPAGFTFLSGDMPSGIDRDNRAATFLASRTARMFDVRHIGVHAGGGHFAHVENPVAVTADIRATFRGLR